MRMAIDNLFSYVVFDFAGSGLSEGKYVSLGISITMKDTMNQKMLSV
jgi:hypothetical protein